jgi:hypothetical protein
MTASDQYRDFSREQENPGAIRGKPGSWYARNVISQATARGTSLSRCSPERERKHIGAGLPPEPLSYSMTSSARARSVGGTSSPSAFAVFRLITSLVFGRRLDREVGGPGSDMPQQHGARFFLEGLGLCHETRCLVATFPSPLQQPSLSPLRVR